MIQKTVYAGQLLGFLQLSPKSTNCASCAIPQVVGPTYSPQLQPQPPNWYRHTELPGAMFSPFRTVLISDVARPGRRLLK